MEKNIGEESSRKEIRKRTFHFSFQVLPRFRQMERSRCRKENQSSLLLPLLLEALGTEG